MGILSHLKPNSGDKVTELKDKIEGLKGANNFGFMRNVYLDIAQQYEKEQNFPEALQNYIYITYFDLCADCRGKEPVCYGTAYGIVKTIKSLKKYFSESMIENCYRLYVPPKFKKPEKASFRKEIKNIFEE